jgi:hypothetical protein
MPGPYTSRVQRNPAAALARAAALAAALAAGCAAPVEPTLTFDRAEYDRMFDAALEAAREDGLDPASSRPRRGPRARCSSRGAPTTRASATRSPTP